METDTQQLAELRRELAELAAQAERLAGRAREISDRLARDAIMAERGAEHEKCSLTEGMAVFAMDPKVPPA